jgi:hypothetical protein
MRLDRASALLAPAIRSVLDFATDSVVIKLAAFAESRRAATLQIHGPDVLFGILTSLVSALGPGDRYDSVTWRAHWLPPNDVAANGFLDAIIRAGFDLPAMRRVFLCGLQATARGWKPSKGDLEVLRGYFRRVGHVPNLENRVLWLREGDLETVASRCHMGRITRGLETLHVFSSYRDNTLEQFALTRGTNGDWRFEDVWDAAVSLCRADLKNPIPGLNASRAATFGRTGTRAYPKPTQSLMKKLGLRTG